MDVFGESDGRLIQKESTVKLANDVPGIGELDL